MTYSSPQISVKLSAFFGTRNEIVKIKDEEITAVKLSVVIGSPCAVQTKSNLVKTGR